MDVGFLTFEQFHGKSNIGSSRIRCDWAIKYWNDVDKDDTSAERFITGKKYDAVIFQKAYWSEYAKAYDGIKILDICDADWLYWGYKIKETIEEVDAITCSTVRIAEFILQMTTKPVWVIPDRIDLKQFEGIKKEIKNEKIESALWYGYADNHQVLEQAIPALAKRKIKLYVLSNKAYVAPPSLRKKMDIQNLPWSSNWANDILKADIVINPRIEKGRFYYKSNNKTIQSWALGMPVAFSDIDIDRLQDIETRKQESENRYKEVVEKYNILDTVKEYKKLIHSLCEKKK